MTPVSLPSLRFEAVGPLGLRAPRLPQLQTKTLSSDVLPTLKRLRTDSPEAREPELAWRSSLTPDQAAALAIARRETGYATSKLRAKRKRQYEQKIVGCAWPSPPIGATAVSTEDWKKARRKEQCRINQANYRKRKRQYEQKIVGEIKGLEQDIELLETHRAASVHGGRQNPIKAVGDFYYAVGVEGEQRPDVQNFRLADGGSPALQSLFDLQREEFDSVESLKLHWLWYREQFRVFQLSITSCERMEAADHVIIKITGQIQLDIYYDVQQRGGESQGYGTITCPITQQYEFETDEQVITRVTSEVDLVSGVAAAQDQSAPDCTLSVLRCLSEGFSMSNRYPNN
ncbi:hypothetical protein PHMEG_0003917 [Phytophthora megakarya]|uniref:BZIP domain-containing protein n=1 Tax=Phytophthora megakarya TaxID=4795 RepID=A0A225WV54_9STRA|nr:hypothetical protein PHMEG_0003917 [Phytophthora megakarya]